MTTKVEELLRLSHAAADGMAVEELAALAQDALEPDSDMDTILHRPTQEDPSATAITGMRSAGWVTVYNKFTGDASTINRNMLTMQLTKLDDQGRRVFTTVRPTGPDGEYLKPHVGTYLCPLHKDHENRAEAERLGLPVCKKSNLVSRFQVERHAANRHPDEMAALKEIETRAREDEERLVRRAIIKQAGMSPVTPAEQPAQELTNTVATPDVRGGIGVHAMDESLFPPKIVVVDTLETTSSAIDLDIEASVAEPPLAPLMPRRRYIPRGPLPGVPVEDRIPVALPDGFKGDLTECPQCGRRTKSTGSQKKKNANVLQHMRAFGHAFPEA